MGSMVQHNIVAMNANRNLNVTTAAQAKSTEKLSTGYKINRAADDAAGLSISEKMRRQVRGLTQASANAQDGISAVQTAEGALTEVHDMLQRMDELATKASNGTLSEDDRKNVQDEVNALLTEIDRVSETTKFNETYLLRGSDGSEMTTMKAHDAGLKGSMTSPASDGSVTFTVASPRVGDTLRVGDSVTIGGKDYTIANTTSIEAQSKDGSKLYTSTGEINTTKYASIQQAVEAGLYKAVTGDQVATDTDFGYDTTTKAPKFNDGITKVYTVENGTATEKTVASTVAHLESGDTVYANGTGAKTPGSVLTTGVDWYKAASTQTTSCDSSGNVTADIMYVDIADGNKIKTLSSGAAAPTSLGTYNGTTNVLAWDNTKGILLDSTAITPDVKVNLSDKFDDGSTITYYTSVKVDSNSKVSADDLEMTAGSEVTLSDAYKLMETELKVANKIGVDANNPPTIVNNDDGTFTITPGKMKTEQSLTFKLHVGSDADMTNKIGISIKAMNTKGLGIKGLDVVGDGNDGGKAATYSIDAIEDAIKRVSEQRSALGAAQNRLEHTIKNLDNIVENTSSAESQIRDTDMATEMVTYSKNNILAQAGQSMLAQANQSNQGVLSLLG